MSPGDKTAMELAAATGRDPRAENERWESNVISAMRDARQRFLQGRTQPQPQLKLTWATKESILQGNAKAGGNLANQDNQGPIGGVLAEISNLFQLIKKDDTHIRITLSTIDDHIPTGFSSTDDPPFVLTVSDSGVVYAHIVYSKTTGTITVWTIEKATTRPTNDDTNTYCTLGYYSTDVHGVLSCLNTGFGPVTSIDCQQFFTPGLPHVRSLTASSGSNTSGFTGIGVFTNLNIVNGLIVSAS